MAIHATASLVAETAEANGRKGGMMTDRSLMVAGNARYAGMLVASLAIICQPARNRRSGVWSITTIAS